MAFPNPLEFVVESSPFSVIKGQRYRLPHGAGVEQLKEAIARSLGLHDPAPLAVHFVDEDGDHCELSSKGDMAEAARLAAMAGEPVRLVVTQPSAAGADARTAAQHRALQAREWRGRAAAAAESATGRFEARVDAKGRTYFVDHVTKTTSWDPPADAERGFGEAAPAAPEVHLEPGPEPETETEPAPVPVPTPEAAAKVKVAKPAAKSKSAKRKAKEQRKAAQQPPVTLEAIAALLDERLSPKHPVLNLRLHVPAPGGGSLSVPYTLNVAEAVESQREHGAVDLDLREALGGQTEPGDRTVVVDLPLHEAVAQQAAQGHVQVHLNALLRELQQPPPQPCGAGSRHPGVMCDACNGPLAGPRYHRIGADYDLCAAAFEALAPEERATYECIAQPGAAPEPMAVQDCLAGAAAEGEMAAIDQACAAKLAIERRKAELESAEPRAMLVAVGPSGERQVEVMLPEDGLTVSPVPVNPQQPDWTDTFQCTVDGRKLCVTRTDCDSGWGQNLELMAAPAAAASPETSTLSMSWDQTGVAALAESPAGGTRQPSETCSEASEFLVLEAASGSEGGFVMVAGDEPDDVEQSTAVIPKQPQNAESAPEQGMTGAAQMREAVLAAVAERGYAGADADAAYDAVEATFSSDLESIRDAAALHRTEGVTVQAAIVEVKTRRVVAEIRRSAEPAAQKPAAAQEQACEQPVPPPAYEQPIAEVAPELPALEPTSELPASEPAPEPPVVEPTPEPLVLDPAPEPLGKVDLAVVELAKQMGFDEELCRQQLSAMGALSKADEVEAVREATRTGEPVVQATAKLKLMRFLNLIM